MKLRQYCPADADAIVTWLKDERAMRQWSAHWYASFPPSADDMNRLYAQMTKDAHPVYLTAVDESGIVGHLLLRTVDAEAKIVRVGFVIVRDQKRGMGYGREMLELAVQYGMEQMQAKKFTLGVFENNASAIKCYQAAGFHTVETDTPEIFAVFGETWRCLEMERDCAAG
ncbi:MAG TPA: GNAT family N-acetyltransferase [Ruminococcus sp.]|nr:GNAT family N-acetyltransferase [Ruminococcus sp.]